MTAATKALSVTYAVDPCYRYPCDDAYRQQPHRIGNDGALMHVCTAGGSESQGWRVATVAVGDGPWRVAVALGRGGWHLIEDDGRYVDQPIRVETSALENATKLAESIVTAAGVMAATWLEDPPTALEE